MIGNEKRTKRAPTPATALIIARGKSPNVMKGADNAVPIDVVENTKSITSAAPLASLLPEAIIAW